MCFIIIFEYFLSKDIVKEQHSAAQCQIRNFSFLKKNHLLSFTHHHSYKIDDLI